MGLAVYGTSLINSLMGLDSEFHEGQDRIIGKVKEAILNGFCDICFFPANKRVYPVQLLFEMDDGYNWAKFHKEVMEGIAIVMVLLHEGFEHA